MYYDNSFLYCNSDHDSKRKMLFNQKNKERTNNDNI